MTEAPKPCTCHPEDNPPVPCEQKYALSECRNARQVRRVYDIMNRDPSRFCADTTCALIVQAFRACLEAGVTVEGEK